MDLGSIIGFVAGGFFIIASIMLSLGGDVAAAAVFINGPSIMITIGGAVAGTLIAMPMDRFITSMKAMGRIFKTPDVDPTGAIQKIITLANLARKEGLLALEESAGGMDDKFLQKGIMLIVDGTDPELVRSIMETEMVYIASRHSNIRGVWEYMASSGPAWGMIGTLLGLIVMLGDMSDPDALGPSMAVALITTLYGSTMANYVCTPVAKKLEIFSSEEILIKEVLIEGMLSVQAGENPRIIEEKLKAFLSPALREASSEEGGGGGDDGGDE